MDNWGCGNVRRAPAGQDESLANGSIRDVIFDGRTGPKFDAARDETGWFVLAHLA